MAISLTPSAVTRVKTFLASRGHGLGLRLGVKSTGCSGYAYVVNYADELQQDDVVFEEQGVKVIVDRKSLIYSDGTQGAFVKQGLKNVSLAYPTGVRMRVWREFYGLIGVAARGVGLASIRSPASPARPISAFPYSPRPDTLPRLPGSPL